MDANPLERLTETLLSGRASVQNWPFGLIPGFISWICAPPELGGSTNVIPPRNRRGLAAISPGLGQQVRAEKYASGSCHRAQKTASGHGVSAAWQVAPKPRDRPTGAPGPSQTCSAKPHLRKIHV